MKVEISKDSGSFTSLAYVSLFLGIYPYAPLRMMLVDPQMPEWLPEITLRGLRVGEATVSIRFYRDKGGSSDYEVLDKRGSVHVIRQPSPWSLTAGFAERLKDFLTSLLPGSEMEEEKRMERTKEPQVVVITGASAGVGRATVRKFARRGRPSGCWRAGERAWKAPGGTWRNWEAAPW